MAKFRLKNGKKMVKKNKDWECHFCEKSFVHQSSLCKHIKIKHFNKKMHKLVKNCKKNGKNGKFSKNDVSYLDWECEFCGQLYKHQSGLSRHKKKCTYVKKQREETCKNGEKIEPSENDKDLLIDKLLDLLKDGKQVTNNNNCNNTTNNININLYLNEECKNALNLTEFVEKIRISLKDIVETRKLGYIDGISKILIKNLENLPQKERPVQCTELKPLEYYVKNDNKWSKNGNMESALLKITKLQFKKLKDWELNNPNWNETEEGIQQWRRMQKSIMGSSEEIELGKMNNEIVENVCENSKIEC
jgi:hypothetical protein